MGVLKEITDKTGLKIATAGFSCLAPGTVIVPHTGYRGYSSQIYRVHLGLIVPDGDIQFKVGSSQTKWENGKGLFAVMMCLYDAKNETRNKCVVLAFNDLCLHEAWNRTEGSRIVLLLDIERYQGALEQLAPSYTKELTSLLAQVTQTEQLADKMTTIRKSMTSDE
jgi:aspartyl/asparaginyl beta-hydroxylase (cupin superfamily)